MWVRMRFDIGWKDLAVGLRFCLTPSSRPSAYEEAQRAWSDRDDCLIGLSVRSAFDLLLQELALNRGDEVMLSAWTVPGMIQIIESHGLVPVPVDIDQRGELCEKSLLQAISSRTRMLVVAHLFGGRAALNHILPTLQKHKILLVEDCAQSFDRVGETGHPESDVVMHSFGPIKTGTALGGAVVQVNTPWIREGMRDRLQSNPVQSRFKFARRILRFSLLKFLSGRFASGLLYRLLSRLGVDVDSTVNSLGKGFSGDGLLKQIRHQPSTPLLLLLARRFKSFDATQIEHRKTLGTIFDRELSRSTASSEDSRWICPMFVREPEATCQRLRAAGFDATARSRMVVVSEADEFRVATIASRNWSQIIFLPWYADLQETDARKMASIVRQSLIERNEVQSSVPRTQMAPTRQMLTDRRESVSINDG